MKCRPPNVSNDTPYDVLKSLTAAEIQLGDSHTFVRQFTTEDVRLFAMASWDINPAHLDEAYAASTRFKKPIVHGALLASMFSMIMGTKFPGLGTIYVGESFQFKAPVYLDEAVTATVRCMNKSEKGRCTMSCVATVNGVEVAIGEATVIAPRIKAVQTAPSLPFLLPHQRPQRRGSGAERPGAGFPIFGAVR